MSTVHNQNGLRFTAKTRINQHAALSGLLAETLDRRRLRTDNCNNSTRGHSISKTNVDQFHCNLSLSSLDVLNLLPNLFDFGLNVNHMTGNLNIAALGSNCIGFPVKLLNQEIKLAVANGMKVLYCIGEKDTELENWDEVLREQLEIGLEGVDKSQVVIGYEPIWSIGPGKTPAGKEYITKIARFVKEVTGGIDVVYGGGLKVDNAEMLASIEEIDGGLIALTRFQGEIGFYPDEYIEIIRTYLGK